MDPPFFQNTLKKQSHWQAIAYVLHFICKNVNNLLKEVIPGFPFLAIYKGVNTLSEYLKQTQSNVDELWFTVNIDPHCCFVWLILGSAAANKQAVTCGSTERFLSEAIASVLPFTFACDSFLWRGSEQEKPTITSANEGHYDFPCRYFEAEYL